MRKLGVLGRGRLGVLVCNAGSRSGLHSHSTSNFDTLTSSNEGVYGQYYLSTDFNRGLTLSPTFYSSFVNSRHCSFSQKALR